MGLIDSKYHNGGLYIIMMFRSTVHYNIGGLYIIKMSRSPVHINIGGLYIITMCSTVHDKEYYIL